VERAHGDNHQAGDGQRPATVGHPGDGVQGEQRGGQDQCPVQPVVSAEIHLGGDGTDGQHRERPPAAQQQYAAGNDGGQQRDAVPQVVGHGGGQQRGEQDHRRGGQVGDMRTGAHRLVQMADDGHGPDATGCPRAGASSGVASPGYRVRGTPRLTRWDDDSGIGARAQ